MAIWNERIKQKRVEKGITLAQIADALNVTEATAQRYESGSIKSVPYEHMCTYAKILNCSPQYLMGWDDDVGDSISDYFNKTLNEILSAIESLGYRIQRFYKNDSIKIKSENDEIIASTTEGELVSNYQKIRLESMRRNISKIIPLKALDTEKESYQFESIIKKYRSLDQHGKEMVDFTLQKEWERSTKIIAFETPALNAASERPDVTSEDEAQTDSVMKTDSEWE